MLIGSSISLPAAPTETELSALTVQELKVLLGVNNWDWVPFKGKVSSPEKKDFHEKSSINKTAASEDTVLDKLKPNPNLGISN